MGRAVASATNELVVLAAGVVSDEDFAAARAEGGPIDGMHATISALQQQLADAEARVGTKGPPSERDMSSLVNMLTAMQGVSGAAMPGVQPSAA